MRLLPAAAAIFAASLLSALAFGGCSSSGGTGAGGSCPCTVGNAGIHYTLACGESSCVTLNGTTTGYRCASDGTHEDPAACTSGGSSGGSGSSSGFVGLDVFVPGQEGGGHDATTVPDGGAPPDMCVALSSTGACANSDCSCPVFDDCSFACGAAAPSATIDCHGATCGISCAGACTASCLQSPDCHVKLGPGGSVLDCVQATSCTATVADLANVDCGQAGTCDVTCTGQCTVTCSQATACKVRCEGTVNQCALDCPGMKLCPDGKTKVCGSGSC